MKHINSFNDFLFEFVKNTSLVSWYNKQILAEVNKICPEFQHETEINSDYFLTTNLEVVLSKIKKIKNLLLSWQKKLLSNGIYLSLDINEFNNNISYSIKDLFVDRVKPPKYVYHVSDTEHRESILKYGLLPRKGDKWQYTLDYPPAVFVSKNVSDLFFKDDEADIWKIDTEHIQNKWWKDLNLSYNNKNHIMTYEAIPVSAIELYKEGSDIAE